MKKKILNVMIALLGCGHLAYSSNTEIMSQTDRLQQVVNAARAKIKADNVVSEFEHRADGVRVVLSTKDHQLLWAGYTCKKDEQGKLFAFEGDEFKVTDMPRQNEQVYRVLQFNKSNNILDPNYDGHGEHWRSKIIVQDIVRQVTKSYSPNYYQRLEKIGKQIENQLLHIPNNKLTDVELIDRVVIAMRQQGVQFNSRMANYLRVNYNY